MDNFEIDDALKTLEVIVDTREQNNPRLRKRLKQFNCPIVREKLKYGDYSIRCNVADLSTKVFVERKKDLDELAMCFGRERGRFEREIKGACEDGYTIYLLIENANWGMLYSDIGYAQNCRSRYPRQSLIASLRAWQVRYGIHIEFCPEIIGGYVIKDILYRELKEYLTNGEFETSGN